MKVSVVVPAYNQSRYLREALASALGQSHADLEVIVVDDGSTDDTRVVCESFDDPRLVYVRQDNDGTMGCGARNHAMLLARGEWIALLDQDDRWDTHKIRRQLERSAEFPAAGAVFCRVRYIDGRGTTTGEQDGPLPEGDVFHALLGKNRFHAVAGMFRRALLPVIGLPHGGVGLPDHALWLALSRRAPVACVDELLADYRVHAQGYQEAQRRSALMRFADDGWQLNAFQAGLLHRGCPACRAGHRRALRGSARSYLRALAMQWSAGRFAGGGVALGRALTAAPLWSVMPWNLLHHGALLALAAVRGLISPVR